MLNAGPWHIKSFFFKCRIVLIFRRYLLAKDGGHKDEIYDCDKILKGMFRVGKIVLAKLSYIRKWLLVPRDGNIVL